MDSNCSGAAQPTIPNDFNITIAFTSDLHGHVDTLARISTLVRQLNTTSTPVVLVDSGDISIGTIFAKHHGAGAMSEIMELMGYQAMAVGNHDVEYVGDLSKKIPLLSINLPGYLPSVILNISGVKVGFLAYTVVENDFKPAEVIHRLKREAACMRRSGAELVLLLGHGQAGFNRYVAENTVGLVDAVLGGHTHQLLGCVGAYCRGPIVLSPGTAGEHLGTLKVTRRAGKTSFHADLVPITDDIPEDVTIKSWLDPKIAALPHDNDLLATVVGEGLDEADTCRRGACLTGSIVATAIRAYFNCSVIALFEAGSIRDVFRNNITEFDLVNTLPWDNLMVQYDMSGEVLMAMLQFGAASVMENQGKGFLHSAGIVSHKERLLSERNEDKMAHKDLLLCSELPRRLSEEQPNIDPRRQYRIAVTDWLASGGDNFGPFIAKASKVSGFESNESKVMARDMVGQYLQATPIIYTRPQSRQTTQEIVPSIKLPLVAIAKALPLSSSMHSAIAICAEIPSMILSHPLRTISTRLQTPTNSGQNPPQGGVWNGVTLTLVAMFLSKIVFWGAYYGAFDALAAWGHHSSAWQQGLLGFGASMVGGIGETLVTHPIWVIVTRVQVFGHRKEVELYENLCDGVGISLILVLFPCVRQFIFEYFVFVSEIVQLREGSPLIQGMLGTVATIVATVLTYPLQTVRTRLQTNTFAGSDVKLCSLFAGLGSKLLAATVHAFVFFFCVKLFELFVLSR